MSATGRNAPCPCGSGLKYKRCCGLEGEKSSLASRVSLSLVALLLLMGAVYLLVQLAGAQVLLPQAAAQTFGLRDLSGPELFERFCSACHGAEGHGDGPVAGGLVSVVPDLTRIAARNSGEFPAGAVRDIIDGRALLVAHGTRTMPVWGYEFWVEEGADVVAESDAREIVRRLVAYLAEIQAPPDAR